MNSMHRIADAARTVLAAALIASFAAATVQAAAAEPPVVREWLQLNAGGTAAAMAMAADGNLVVAGSLSNDYLIQKYDPQGNCLWTQQYSNGWELDMPTSVAIDANGNIIVTGSTGWDPHQDYLTVKFDREGNFLWMKTYDGPPNIYALDIAYAVAVDTAGNVFVTGTSYGGWDFYYDTVTVKYDPDGNQLWTKRYTGSGYNPDAAYDIGVDPSGNVVVTGTTYPYWGRMDKVFCTIKYSTDGAELWRQNLAISGRDVATALDIDGAGNIVVAGSTISDCATAMYDPDGNLLWQHRLSSEGKEIDTGNDVAFDPFGNVVVVGSYYSDRTTGTDALTVKYDPAGNLIWSQTCTGPGRNTDIAKRVLVDAEGNVFVAGTSYGGAAAKNDLLILKYAPDGTKRWGRRVNGTESANDDLMAMAIDGQGNVFVSGTMYDASGWSPSLGIVKMAGAKVREIAFNPVPHTGGTLLEATVRLNGVAPAHGVKVVLSSGNALLAAVPATLTVPGGTDSIAFLVSTPAVAKAQKVKIGAVVPGSIRLFQDLTILPPVPTSLFLVPQKVTGGLPSTATVTLSGPAPAGGIELSLVSSDSAATPEAATLLIPQGQTQGTFAVNTVPVETSVVARISARHKGIAVRGFLRVIPAP